MVYAHRVWVSCYGANYIGTIHGREWLWHRGQVKGDFYSGNNYLYRNGLLSTVTCPFPVGVANLPPRAFQTQARFDISYEK